MPTSKWSVREQDDFIASIEHWGNVPEGGRAAQSRVNQEHEDPLIVAIKAGKQRFTAFREEKWPYVDRVRQLSERG